MINKNRMKKKEKKKKKNWDEPLRRMPKREKQNEIMSYVETIK